MKTKSINNRSELEKALSSRQVNYLLLYKAGTEQSQCALEGLQQLDNKVSDPNDVLIADVTNVRDIHPEYNIESVPSLLKFSDKKLITVYKGCNGKGFYESVFSAKRAVTDAGDEGPSWRVTVYSTPSCSWCTTLKSYLREKNIIFTDIDVSADQKAAEAMVSRSGQQGVPQTDINGEIVVGFDKTKIDRLLQKVR